MIFTNKKELALITFDILKDKPKFSFFLVTKSNQYKDLGLKTGVYIMVNNDKQSAAFNITPLDAIFSFLTFVFIVSFLLSLLFIV